MAVLTRTSTIFIEFKNLLCNTDFYVIKFLLKLMETTDLNFFRPIVNEFDGESDEYILERLLMKFNINPLLDYLDMNQMKDDVNPIKECDKMYHICLCDDIGALDHLRPTNLHMALKNLPSKEVDHIYVYYPEYSPAIHFFINKLFDDSQKVSLVTGDIHQVIKDIHADSYFVNDVLCINSLLEKRVSTNTIDFVCLDYRCNMIDNGITIDLDLPIPANDIYEKYNINVRFMKRPI